MPDRLKDIIARIGADTGLNLVDAYEQGKQKKEKDPEKKPSPQEKEKEQQQEIEETRKKFTNRSAKKAYDRALKNMKPKNRAKEAKRNRSNDIRRMHKLQKNLEKTHGPGVCPELIPTHLYKQTWQIIVDSTGAAAREYLAACPHSIAKTRIRRTALCPDEQGVPKYPLEGHSRGAVRARCVLAFGLLLLGLSRRRKRKGPWNRLVKGIPLLSLRKALAHPAIRTEIPSINTLIGKHRPDPENELIDGGVGYLRALKNSEFCYSLQARWKEGEKPEHRAWQNIGQNEIVPDETPSGWRVSLSRYWIISDQFTSARDAKRQAELWLDHIAGNLPDETAHIPDSHQTSQRSVPALSPSPPS